MKQRKYELAILRVMGSSRSGLFLLILIEGLGIAFLGWLCGTLLSHVGMMILGNYLTEDFGYDFQAWVLLKEEWYLFFISLGLGAVAALVPAWKAANTDINQTLGEK